MLEQERVDEVSDDLKSVEVSLPSRCLDYPAPARGLFLVKPPRVEQVEFLAGMNAANYDEQLTRLLRSMIVSPTIVPPEDMTIGDRQHLHVWVRAQIDPTYRFETTCPKCKHVNKSYKLAIEDIPIIGVPKEYSPNLQLTLPKSGARVDVRLETARDRGMIEELAPEGFTEWVIRKAMVVNSVNDEVLDPKARCEWMRKLPAGDDIFMSEYLKWQRHGPDFKNCPFKCVQCGEDGVLNMPFRLEFFMPTVHAAAAFADAIRGRGVGEDGGVPGDAGDQEDGV